MNVGNTQNIISFCSGYGGLDLGLKRVWPDCRTVAYVEIEAFAIANLVAKMEQGKLDSAPIWTNLKTFDAKPFRGKIHGFTAGYPCQPFSNAGKRQGTEGPRHLWPYIEEHIRTIRPLWCYFENVGGHLSLGFDEVYRSLSDLGYSVEAGLFTASEVGAPHKRERLFILAYRCGCGLEREFQQRQGNNSKLDGIHKHPKERRDAIRSRTKGCSTSELAYTEMPECEPGNKGNCEQGQENEGRWPARPGQEQYDWEEPRTVEPGMGRAIDGFKSRVDELRLLGNGVVRYQAELALRYLTNKQ